MRHFHHMLPLVLCLGLTACTAQSSLTGADAESSYVIAEEASVPSATPSAVVTPLPPSPTPTITPIPTPACAETNGLVAAPTIASTILPDPIETRVYLPPCYSDSQQRYPVLYLLHGLRSTESQWVELGAATAADTLIRLKEIAPLIIVMPRDHLSAQFDLAFMTDVVPYIDETYRTLTDREHRAIGGLSWGGAWSVHIGLRYPDQFGRIGAHSPAVMTGDRPNITYWIQQLLPEQTPRIYIDVGDNDGQRVDASWVDEKLTQANVAHTFIIQPGKHVAEYWSTHLPEYLRFYAADWRATQNEVDGTR